MNEFKIKNGLIVEGNISASSFTGSLYGSSSYASTASYITDFNLVRENLYTGLQYGGYITQSSSTTFNVSSGSGIIVNLNASSTAVPQPIVTYVNWNNFTNVTSSYISTSTQIYIGIDSTGALIERTTPWLDGDWNTSIYLGTVLHPNQSTINATIAFPNVAYGWKQRSYDFVKAFGALKLSGFGMVPSGSSTGSLVIQSGMAWADGRNYQTDPNNPSYITDGGTNVSKIYRFYSSASGFVYNTNGGSGYGAIDYNHYNNNGTLTLLSQTGKNRVWQNQRVFWFPNSATKAIIVYYGQVTYASQTEAINNAPYEAFSEAPNTRDSAIYLGTLTVRNDCDFNDSTSYKILPAGIFRNVGGSSGGSGALTLHLTDLVDVDAAAPSDGDILIYNSSSALWEHVPNAVSGSGVMLPNNNEQLLYNFSGSISSSNKLKYSLISGFANPTLQILGEGNLTTPRSGCNFIIEQSSSVNNRFEMVTHGNNQNLIIGKNSGGTQSSPTTSSKDTVFLQLNVEGYDGTVYRINQNQITLAAAEDWSATARGTYIKFNTTPTGSISNTEVMRIEGGSISASYHGLVTIQGLLDTDGFSTNIVTSTTNYTLGKKNYTVMFSGSTALTASLPAASTVVNQIYNIKNLTDYPVLVKDGVSLIDGQSSWIINSKYTTMTVQSDGTNYFTI